MAKCFVTGVELPLSETFVLDIPVAYRILKDLRQRLGAMERLIEQLSPWDDAEVFDAKKREMLVIKQRRLVSPGVAKALSSVSPENDLFIPWPVWRERRKRIKAQENQQGKSEEMNDPGCPGQEQGENDHGTEA